MTQLSLLDPQLDLFGAGSRPAQVFREHTTDMLDAAGRVTADPARAQRVRVRLRISGDTDTAPLPSGPLTYDECSEWLEPCRLYQCRYRLSDEAEQRTRYDHDMDDDDRAAGVPERGYGWWCALQVVEAHPEGLGSKPLAALMGVKPEDIERMALEPALDAYLREDVSLDDTSAGNYGDEGRHHGFHFEEVDEDVTSNDCRRIVVPGEETCKCEAPQGARGKPCAVCGVRIKMGRQPLRVVGKRRKKGDQWEGHVRRVPEVFVRADGTEVRTVDARLLEPARSPELTVVSTAEIRAAQTTGKASPMFPQYDMASMLRARGKQEAA